MKKEIVYSSLQNALDSLRIAEDELSRPAEDSVTLCACNSTRYALNEFLRTFLLDHLSSVDPDLDTDELLALCSTIDKQFSTINLSSFVCRIHQGDGGNEKLYCLSVEKVNDCFETTRAVKELVMAKLLVSKLNIS